MKTYGLVAVWLREFLTSALDGGWWSVLRRGHFTPGRVDARAGLNAVAKRKNPFSAPAGNQSPVFQPVTQSVHWWRVQVVNFPISSLLQHPAISCLLDPNILQHPVLKHPQPAEDSH